MNTAHLTPDLYWLTLTGLMTALLWFPHIAYLIFKQEGIIGAFMDRQGENIPDPIWAKRAKRAHINAQLNFGVLAGLVIIAHIIGISPAWLSMMVIIYFFARAGHYLVYTLGLPVFRQVLFVIGMTVQTVIAVSILQAF